MKRGIQIYFAHECISSKYSTFKNLNLIVHAFIRDFSDTHTGQFQYS